MAESIRTIRASFDPSRPTFGPTTREWRLHLFFFALTVLSTTFAGVMQVAPEVPTATPSLTAPLDYLLYVPHLYLNEVAALTRYALFHPVLLVKGAAFSLSLLAILFSHEMGHYLACRHYDVDATLPYFIPAPPLFLAGTFGAFIKIRSPIPTRRALFDIGLAGPLAGFVMALPVAVVGILTAVPAAPLQGSEIVFNDPLLFRLLGKVFGVRLDAAAPNPYYMAAWIGLLVTSLNLMPVGQLDGGHGTFAVFGQRAHQIIGRVAFVSVVVLALLGFWWHHSPSGFLFAVLLGVMLRVRHPQPAVMEPLGTARVLVAILTLLVFVLCFWPFPISINY